MPQIDIIDSIKIIINSGDHNPPHYHVIYNENEALIDIRTGNIIKGYLPPKI